MSYPLYLFHWPVIMLVQQAWGLEAFSQKLICVPVSFCLAAFTYHCVESPIRKWSPLRSGTVFFFCILGIFLVQLLLLGLKGPLYGRFWVQADFPAQPHAVPGDLYAATSVPLATC